MCEKLIHGLNSMACANNVLPTFMGTPREWSQSRKVTQFWLFVVQIGTKQNRLETRASA